MIGNVNTSRHYGSTGSSEGDTGDDERAVSAIFSDAEAASAAIRELREIGIAPGDISVISRDDGAEGGESSMAGVAREQAPEEANAYRASPELPNDEDLPTTQAAMTATDMPDVGDYDAPPGGFPAGRERPGLSRDSDMVRRNEAETNADEDIYSDFPHEPGGVNPAAPTAHNAVSDVQSATPGRTGAAGNAATGAGIGGLVGLLVGLAGMAVPGVGLFVAAGPLAGVLSGLVTGGAAGGIIGALSGIGLPESYAREYAAAIEQGKTLVSVRTDSLTHDPVERVLVANGGDALH